MPIHGKKEIKHFVRVVVLIKIKTHTKLMRHTPWTLEWNRNSPTQHRSSSWKRASPWIALQLLTPHIKSPWHCASLWHKPAPTGHANSSQQFSSRVHCPWLISVQVATQNQRNITKRNQTTAQREFAFVCVNTVCNHERTRILLTRTAMQDKSAFVIPNNTSNVNLVKFFVRLLLWSLLLEATNV